MRAADTRGPPPPPAHFLEPHLEGVFQQGMDGSQYIYQDRYDVLQMRVEPTSASDASVALSRRSAALTETEVGTEMSANGTNGEGGGNEEKSTSRSGAEDEDRRRRSPVEGDMMRRKSFVEPDSRRSKLEVELASKEREVSHLVDEMERLQSSINNLKEISTTKISQLEDMVCEKDRIIRDLAEKLLRQKDYSDLKRELRLLKALELSGWQPWLTPEPQTTSELASPAEEIKEGLVSNGRASSPGEEIIEEEEEELESGSPCSAGTPPPLEKNVVSPPPTLDTHGPAGRLQRCIREGLGRLGEPLDTRGVAVGVRELLGAHGVGQRLFARLVLGLSQGTVSELLSKPKPWAKLTEKGRDSYRKMAAFASDPVCVHLLKAALPRKGREGSVPKSDDSSPRPEGATTNVPAQEEKTEETIHTSQKETRLPTMSPHEAPRPYPCAPPPEFSPIVLAHIYQEELLKLLGKRLKVDGSNENLPKQDEVRRALSIYHRELALLAMHGGNPQIARADRHPCGPPPFCPAEQHCCCLQPPDPGPYAVLSPYSAATQPLLPLEGTSQNADESSPLQRMQSITNSLLSSSTAGPGPLGPLQGTQRPSKAILPPITQQQFDSYNNLNTEEIVKRVKEQLSQYSISQRLFGESVLGLSQGSVSDLLARPKPWPMLTQKGREPFIRMQMFLEDEAAVHKLVASQYKVAPERLMRLGGAAFPVPHGPPRFSPVCSEPNYMSAHRGQPTIAATAPHSPSPQRSPSAPESPVSGPGSLPRAPGRRNCGSRGLLPSCGTQPSVYEMAAVTSDLDTHLVTARIKETLTVHNIGQKLFGEAVLGLSQGSVSELLSKPKPWHMLSIKGREPFIRMQLWLQDPHNVEKLQAIKSERREANKRRRNNIEMEMPPPPLPCETKPPQQAYPQNPLPSGFLYPPVKRPRVLFSEEQKEAMKLAYALDPYPSTAVMEFLSTELGLSVRTITNWFHNHRMRLKQQNGDESEGPTHSTPPNENSTFDPIHFRMLLGQRLVEMCSKTTVPCVTTYPSNDALKSCYSFKDISTQSDSEPDTLDLSMPSQKQLRDNSSASDNNKKSHTIPVPVPPSSNQNLSSFKNSNEEKTNFSYHEHGNSDTFKSHSSQSTQNSSQGSNRRKPAAPQWVNPGLDMSPDSDLCSFDEDEGEEDTVNDERNINETTAKKQIINGVCVRQTDLACTEEQLNNDLVHVLPIPASDDRARFEREENIRRLERAIEEEEERWDLSESDEEGENQDDRHSDIEISHNQDSRL